MAAEVTIRDARTGERDVLLELQRRSAMHRKSDRKQLRALLADAADRAAASGTERIEVTANPNARAFYGSAGFESGKEVATRFGPALRMRLPLGSRFQVPRD